MNKLNLFPPWMRQYKRRQRMIVILAALQAAVFLMLGGAVFTMRAIDNREKERSAQLARQIAAIDIAALTAADTASETEFIQSLSSPDAFNPEWLRAIFDYVPPNVQLAYIDYAGTEIILTAYAGDLTDIDTHRLQLSETLYFDPVMLGTINRADGGRVRYILRLGVKT